MSTPAVDAGGGEVGGPAPSWRRQRDGAAPTARAAERVIVYDPLAAVVVVVKPLPKESGSWITAFGSAEPVRRGCLTLVMPSPLTPESGTRT